MKDDLVSGQPLVGNDLVLVPTSAPARNHAAFISSVADLLRGDFKRSEYGKVILPLTVLRRLDGVLPRLRSRSSRDPSGCPRDSTPS